MGDNDEGRQRLRAPATLRTEPRHKLTTVEECEQVADKDCLSATLQSGNNLVVARRRLFPPSSAARFAKITPSRSARDLAARRLPTLPRHSLPNWLIK